MVETTTPGAVGGSTGLITIVRPAEPTAVTVPSAAIVHVMVEPSAAWTEP